MNGFSKIASDILENSGGSVWNDGNFRTFQAAGQKPAIALGHRHLYVLIWLCHTYHIHSQLHISKHFAFSKPVDWGL